MKRKLIAIVVAISIVLLFLLVPVYPTTTYWPCGDACSYDLSASHPVFLPGYESLTCAAFGVGAGYSTAGAWGTDGTSYRLSCPPKTINAVGNSFG